MQIQPSSNRDIIHTISMADLIFWDFDGVIKDSVESKTNAFRRLFQPFGKLISQRVCQHHESHGGVSRFEKIPLYLDWAGLTVTPALVHEFCSRFSDYVLQDVIDSPWIPGVLNYLQKQSTQQYFVIITATPQSEIEYILKTLGIDQHFREVHGAPAVKSRSISDILFRLDLDPSKTLMLGDSSTDLLAAKANDVQFVLRKTPLNQTLQTHFNGMSYHHMCYE